MKRIKHLFIIQSVRDHVHASVQDSVWASVQDSVLDSTDSPIGISIYVSVWIPIRNQLKDNK